MKFKKITALIIIIGILFSGIFIYAEEKYATRGKAAEMLLNAADFYNPGVAEEDIIKGYEDGLLHKEDSVTRAEALVMLNRAFGGLPAPEGYNAKIALKPDSFTDISDWATDELNQVLNSGIVMGTAKGVFSPDEPVTEEQLRFFISRTYALFASNQNDDFYASVNKDKLDALELKPGHTSTGMLYELQDKSNESVSGIIKEITSKEHKYGTPEQKISDLYRNVLDTESRNKAGITPIKKYLDMLDNAKTIDDLIKFQNTTYNDICLAPFLGFGLSVDLKDSAKYILTFASYGPGMDKSFYQDEDESKKSAYLEYLKTLLIIGGENEEKAKLDAEKVYEFEKPIALKSLDTEEYSDVDKVYNIYTFDEINKMIPSVDLSEVLKSFGFKKADEILISDTGAVTEALKLFNNDNIDVLKILAKINILDGTGGMLSSDFKDAASRFKEKLYGVSGARSDEETASGVVMSAMPDYIGKIYCEKYFDEESKKDVENMIKDFIKIYNEKIDKLDWMSDKTKAKAKDKLNNIKIKIGYPDDWSTYIDNVDIKPVSKGGSYFQNIIDIQKESDKYVTQLQNADVDKSMWAIYPYTVNAGYSPTSNDITFPAAILQPPIYDKNAPYEENLGKIGYVIAHEITHAFDNNGAKFDKEGNAFDWWTDEDYKAFEKLCSNVVDFYEGAEGIPGVSQSGKLTLSENVADLGAVSCILELLSKKENPDYKKFFEAVANVWLYYAPREYCEYMAKNDVHSPAKSRVNRVLVNFDEFYDTYGITEGDGMYVAPQNRVKIW